MRILGIPVTTRIVLLLFVAAMTLWLAIDGRHHWHEIRFSYVSSQLSWEQIVSGEFNPHQVDTNIDEISSAGFYYAKILHIWLLRTLFGWISPAVGGFELAVALSIISIGLSVWMAYFIFLRLLKTRQQARLTVLSFLLLPITPYLAGKLLSEVTALLMVSLSIWTLIIAMDTKGQTGKRIGFASMSGLFLLFSALSRVDIVLCFYCFCMAVVFSTRETKDRVGIFKVTCIASAIFVLGYLGAMYFLGMDGQAFVRYFGEFAGSVRKSNIMSILGILTFGGVVYIFALCAIFGNERNKVLLLAVWFCLSFGISVLITSNYMVEPRYLVHGLLPLAGLGGIGLGVLWQKLPLMRFKEALALGLIVAILAINAVIVKLMPYELDRLALNRAVDQIMERDHNSIILIPWAYTDFHFLKMTRPNASVYNVNSFIRDGRAVKPTQAWQERFERWYGRFYIDKPGELNGMLLRHPVYYLGWRVYPPAEYMKGVADVVGSKSISSVVDQAPLKNHLSQSWVWYSDSYRFAPAGKWGQYEYYKLSFSGAQSTTSGESGS